MEKQLLARVSFGVFLFLNLILGLVRGRNVKTFDKYVFNDRATSSGVLAITIIATIIDARYVTSGIVASQENGIISTVFEIISFPIIALFFGYCVFPNLVYFQNCYTLGEVMGKLYGKYAQILTGFYSVIVSLALVVAQLVAMGSLGTLLGWESRTVILIVGITVTCYTLLGGIRSVTATDVLQFICLFGGLLFVASRVFTFKSMESVGALFQKVNDRHPKNMTFWKHPAFGRHCLWVIGMPTFFMAPPIIHRVLMAQNAKQIKQSFAGFAVFYPLLIFLLTIIGFGILVVKGSNTRIPGGHVFTEISEHLKFGNTLGSLPLVLMLTAVVMSTADSFLNSLVIVVIRDILKPLSPKKKPIQEMRWTFGMAFVAGTLATLLAWISHTQESSNFNNFAMYALGVLLLPFIMGIMGLKLNRINFYIHSFVFLVSCSTLLLLAHKNYFVGSNLHTWKSYPLRRKLRYVFPISLFASSFFSLLSHFLVHRRFVWIKRKKPQRKQLGFSGHTLHWRDFFVRPLAFAQDKMRRHGSQPTLLGFSLALLYLMPNLTGKQMLEAYAMLFLIVRLIGATLCAGLMLHNVWPFALKRYFPLFWFLALLYCIPFSHILLWLYNPSSSVNLVLLVLSIILLNLLVDRATYVILTILGSSLAFLLYGCTVPSNLASIDPGKDFVIDFDKAWTGSVSALLAILVGLLFASRKEQVNTRRIQRNRVVSSAFGHELNEMLQIMHYCASQLPVTKHDPKEIDVEGEEYVALSKKDYLQIGKAKDKITMYIQEASKQLQIFSDIIATDNIQEFDMISLPASEVVKTSYPFISVKYRNKVKIVESTDFNIRVHPTLIHNLISNLVKNAYFHGGAEKITLGWHKETGEIFVQDNGRGIPKHVLPHIFDLEFTTGTVNEGIGLSFLDMMMKVMYGSIRCQTSTKEGSSGTTFFLKFPTSQKV